VTTTGFGVLGSVVGLVWFLLIVAAAVWAQRAEGRAA
jgi:hypothetical protein